MPSPRFQGETAVDPSPLGQPLHFEFSGKTAPNRFLKAAMTERQSSWSATDLPKRGVPSPELVNLYRRWGEGGYGVILTGNVMIAYDQLEAAGNPIIPPDAPFEGQRFERFRDLATAAKAQGSLVVMQVSHPGRQVAEVIQPHPISASDVQLAGTVMGMTFAKPRPMEAPKDFDAVIDGFAHAAEYAQRAGYDGVQLHGAHGYLLAQFLSPTTNKRTDKYGGSIENRGRLISEVAAAIKKRVNDPSFSLAIKINSVEFQDAGFTPEDCAALCADLERAGFDWVELSGGTYQELAFVHKRDSTRKREAYFLEFADLIVPQLKKTKAYVTGGLRTTSAMVAALKTVHGVGLGRPTAHEIDLPRKILEDKVSGSLQNRVDEQNFFLDNVAAGTQMKTVGRDKQPLDLTREDHLQVLLKSMEPWGKAMAANSDNSKYGYVDIIDFDLQPYGTPYSEA